MYLMMNAHEALESQNEGWIRLEFHKQTFGYELSVIDSGPGIRADVREKIFQPFFTTKDPKIHAGLGLNTAREQVESMGGLLTYDSHSSNTKFIISIPEVTGGSGGFHSNSFFESLGIKF